MENSISSSLQSNNPISQDANSSSRESAESKGKFKGRKVVRDSARKGRVSPSGPFACITKDFMKSKEKYFVEEKLPINIPLEVASGIVSCLGFKFFFQVLDRAINNCVEYKCVPIRMGIRVACTTDEKGEVEYLKHEQLDVDDVAWVYQSFQGKQNILGSEVPKPDQFYWYRFCRLRNVPIKEIDRELAFATKKFVNMLENVEGPRKKYFVNRLGLDKKFELYFLLLQEVAMIAKNIQADESIQGFKKEIDKMCTVIVERQNWTIKCARSMKAPEGFMGALLSRGHRINNDTEEYAKILKSYLCYITASGDYHFSGSIPILQARKDSIEPNVFNAYQLREFIEDVEANVCQKLVLAVKFIECYDQYKKFYEQSKVEIETLKHNTYIKEEEEISKPNLSYNFTPKVPTHSQLKMRVSLNFWENRTKGTEFENIYQLAQQYYLIYIYITQMKRLLHPEFEELLRDYNKSYASNKDHISIPRAHNEIDPNVFIEKNLSNLFEEQSTVDEKDEWLPDHLKQKAASKNSGGKKKHPKKTQKSKPQKPAVVDPKKDEIMIEEEIPEQLFDLKKNEEAPKKDEQRDISGKLEEAEEVAEPVDFDLKVSSGTQSNNNTEESLGKEDNNQNKSINEIVFATLRQTLNSKNQATLDILFPLKSGKKDSNLKIEPKDVKLLSKEIADKGFAGDQFKDDIEKAVHPNHGTGEGSKLPAFGSYLDAFRSVFLKHGIFTESDSIQRVIEKQNHQYLLEAYINRLKEVLVKNGHLFESSSTSEGGKNTPANKDNGSKKSTTKGKKKKK